ncbi:hypothetical protein F4801DRAFT_584144 [Xylaria longipes]|nr:hypothetical protein F4801DRAFT_584144 [Xylaria longipes]
MALRVDSQWCGLGYMPGSGGESGTLRTLSFKIGEVTKTSRTKLGSEASDAKAIKRRWDDIMTELEQQLYEKESGAWPAMHIQKRNWANVPWYRACIQMMETRLPARRRNHEGTPARRALLSSESGLCSSVRKKGLLA